MKDIFTQLKESKGVVCEPKNALNENDAFESLTETKANIDSQLNEAVDIMPIVKVVAQALTQLTGKPWNQGGGKDGCAWRKTKFSLKNPGRLKSFNMKDLSDENMKELMRLVAKNNNSMKIAISKKSIPVLFDIDGINYEIGACSKRPDIIISTDGDKTDTKYLDDPEFYEKLY